MQFLKFNTITVIANVTVSVTNRNEKRWNRSSEVTQDKKIRAKRYEWIVAIGYNNSGNNYNNDRNTWS